MATWTQEDLDAARAALRQALLGKAVVFGDRSWTSHNLKELQDLVALMEPVVAAETGTATGYRLASISKGV